MARRIKIGTVALDHYILTATRGKPWSLAMDWAGKPYDVFQPWEFRNWDDLWWGIQRRCLLSGLEAGSPSYGIKRGGWSKNEVEVFIEVTRSRDRYWAMQRRGRRNEWLLPRAETRTMEPSDELSGCISK